MKILKKVKVGGLQYDVVESSDVAKEGNVFGSTHYVHQQKIFLDPRESQQMKENTFFHEILHTIWFHVGLRTRFKERKNEEEEIIDALSNGLYQVLKDNDILK